MKVAIDLIAMPEKKLLRARLLIGPLLLSILWQQSVSSAELGFSFSGSVAFSSPFDPPWGASISQSAQVIGHFVYETNTTLTHEIAGCDCSGYRQRHVNGFAATFGATSVQADEYVMVIRNDVLQPNQSMIDSISIQFADNFTPPLQIPLLVNGSPKSMGVFQIEFVGNANMFQDSTLPEMIDPSVLDLPSPFNVLTDNAPPSQPDVLFTVGALTSVATHSSDHDLDGDVDGDDFLIWQRNLGGAGQNGDANSDNEVNGADLAQWVESHGAAPVLPSVPVPEPDGVVAPAVLLLIGLWIRQRCTVPAT